MIELELVDIFRELYPEKKMFTWRKFNSPKRGRLDYFLLSEDLIPETTDIKEEVSYRSDHSPVILFLKTKNAQRDRPFWKFNNSLLRDNEYIKLVKQVITDVKTQYYVASL